MSVQIKIKKLHPHAKIPEYAKPGDAGVDLTAVHVEEKDGKLYCHTGLAIELPEGYVGKIYPRSSVHKKDLVLANSVGILDSGYRAELLVVFKTLNSRMNFYQPGDRVAQLIVEPIPTMLFKQVNELSETERGEGGFGSTGN